MARFRKQAVVVEAVQLTEQTTVSTLEGRMVGNKGDWVITGVAGEKYPCSDDTFCKTYEHIKGNTFRKRQLEVEAILLRHRTTIETPGGALVGQPGDWLISGVNESQYPCSSEVFLQTYESVGSS